VIYFLSLDNNMMKTVLNLSEPMHEFWKIYSVAVVKFGVNSGSGYRILAVLKSR